MNVRKTILYIHHGKGLGGAPISLLTLIKGLDLAKYRPLVLFLYDSAAIQLFLQAGIEVLGPINLSDFSHTQVYWFRWYHLHHIAKALFQSFKSFFVARKILRTIKPNIVHLNTSTLTAWGLAAKQENISLVWHIRESLAEGYLGLRRWVIKKIIARCATIIVPICKTDGRFWSEKKQILYNPVDTTRFLPSVRATPLPHDKQYLLFIGGLSHQKGTALMLTIFNHVVQALPDTMLIIAGDFKKPLKNGLSPEQKSIHQAYNLYEKLKANIIITGPTQEIPALMAAASIIFFPAQVDHFARPVIEAGCMAKPVIVSDFPQLQEVVHHGKTGFLLPPKNITTWVSTTINLLNNPTLQKEMGAAAYLFCQENFPLHRYAKEIDLVYTNILDDKTKIISS